MYPFPFGRLILIQVSLFYIMSYDLSISNSPSLVAPKVEKVSRNFLLSGLGEKKMDQLVR